jgi:uncharacterized protein YycO
MNFLYRKLINYLLSTKLYKYLLKNVIPYIRFSTYYTNLRGKKYHKLYRHLKAGDIILTLDKKKLTTLLIPGDFSHAAMCVSKDENWEVSEMTHDDYTKSTFFDICKESDRVVILRASVNKDIILRAIEKCKTFKDARYDSSFDLGVKSLYCSELIYQSYENNSLGANLKDFIGLGRPYISPQGLYKAKNLSIILDSNSL